MEDTNLKIYYVTFHNVHTALQFERTLKAKNIDMRLIPVPRAISATCGMAAKISEQEWQRVEAILLQSELEVEKIYSSQRQIFKEVILMP